MNQRTDKYGNIIVEEIYDASSNLSYQKLRKVGGEILEQFYTYDANNKVTHCKRIFHVAKKQLVNEIFYEYGIDGKRIFEKFVDSGFSTERRYDYDREIIHITHIGRPTQTIPMSYKQLDLFETENI